MTTANQDINAFMKLHRHQKGANEVITNTRIGEGMQGGSYHISEEDYPRFLETYYRDIVAKGKTDFYTEKQLDNNGPCLVDLDFHYSLDCNERLYTKDHIDDLVEAYLGELRKMYQFDQETDFPVYVLEKPAINRVEAKGIVKDGIHLIIGIRMERRAQVILRERMVPKLQEMWGEELPIQNTGGWEDVLDKSITLGHANWQLYGSGKPNHTTYTLTYVYSVKFDPTDNEFMTDCKSVAGDKLDIKEIFPKLSARYKDHAAFFYKSEFTKELDKLPSSPVRVRTPGSMRVGALGNNAGASNDHILSIRNAQDLTNAIAQFLDSLSEHDIELRDTYEYTMILPPTYYENGSYDKWIRVGWALRNISNRALIIWVAMSAKANSFNYATDIPGLYDKWHKFDMGNPNGLTKRSIMYWCRSDVPAEYKEIRKRSTEYILDRTLGSYEDVDDESKTDKKGCTDYDIATVLHHMYADIYVCVSIKNNIWYAYSEPRWMKIDSGTTLRRAISNELRSLYSRKVTQYMEEVNRLNEVEDAYKIKKMKKYIDKLLGVCARLGTTKDKKNIMTESQELFYDKEFIQKLDANPYLLCFKNGVVDFKERRFRRGTPEDYLTKCTNIDYVPINPTEHAPIMDEIRDFMRKLFPMQDVHDYMWEHLASALIGVLPDQTWNNYIGEGQNGKSMLVKMMELILGDYKGSVATNLLTDSRTKIGGAAPEIIALRGLRYAVMQETRKGEVLNEAVMKQLTSGMDTIEGRGLYMENVEVFYPQFKLALCCNHLMDIKTNDHGTWRRIRVVPFVSLFTDTPVANDPAKPYQFKIDRTLEERCHGWKEVFASMLVDIGYQTQGKVKDCETIMAASNSYRQSQDIIAEFIADRVIRVPGACITKTELQQEFKIWHEGTYGRGGPKTKDVQEYMNRAFKYVAARKGWVDVSIDYQSAIANGSDAGSDGMGPDNNDMSDF